MLDELPDIGILGCNEWPLTFGSNLTSRYTEKHSAENVTTTCNIVYPDELEDRRYRWQNDNDWKGLSILDGYQHQTLDWWCIWIYKCGRPTQYREDAQLCAINGLLRISFYNKGKFRDCICMQWLSHRCMWHRFKDCWRQWMTEKRRTRKTLLRWHIENSVSLDLLEINNNGGKVHKIGGRLSVPPIQTSTDEMIYRSLQ